MKRGGKKRQPTRQSRQSQIVQKTVTATATASSSEQNNDLKELLIGLNMAFQTKQNIPSFDGSGDVLTWIEDYENITSTYSWTSNIQTKQLSNNLEGLALTWYKGEQQRNKSIFETWTSTRERLIAAFKPQTYELDQRKELNKRQEKGEDILQFMEEKCLLGGRLRLNEKELIQQVIISLSPEYYSKIADKHFKSLDDLRSKLRKLQSVAGRENL